MARFLGFIPRHDLVAFPLITFALGWLFYIPGALVMNSGRGSMVGPMLLHAGLNLSMAVIAPDTWWFAVLTFGAAAVIAVIVGPRDLGGRPRVTLPPAGEPPRRDPLA